MKLIYLTFYYRLLIIVFSALIFNSGDVYAQSTSKFKENVIRIKFKETVSGRLDKMSSKPQVKTKDGIILTGFDSLDQLNRKYNTIQFKRVFPQAGKFEPRHRENGLHLWYEMTFDEKTKVNIDNCIAKYKSDKSIKTAEPVYEKRLIDDIINNNATQDNNPSLSFTTNDPEFTNQWHYDNTGQTGGTPGADISLKNAWDIEMGSTNAIVAVIDGGIDINHEDLSNSMWVNQAELNGTTGVDDDNNGYIDDIYGYNLGDNSGTIYPDNHGTHVGGTIGAATNNGIGVSGIAGGSGSGDGVRLMSCSVFGKFSNGGFDQAFVYAADNGAVIAQNSWSYTSVGVYEQSVLDAIDYFIANAGYDEYGNPVGPLLGGIVIFAAGNDNDNGPWYPAYYEPVLSVASTNHNDQRSYYSNYGTWVDIAAPGGETAVTNQGVLSTLPSNTYGYYQGTSMACPHVSGVAALIVSEYGGTSLFSQMVWDRLVQTTDSIDPLNPGYEGQLGSGRLNAFNTLQQNDSIAPDAITDLAVSDTGLVNVILSWTATGSSADSGVASVYDIRYAEFMIDSANFNSATWVSNAQKPAAAGETETFEITGLQPSTIYYFAIKASDYFGNISSISNVISARTYDPPIISVSPDSLIANLFTGDSVTQYLTIDNSTGGSNLNFDISIEGVEATAMSGKVHFALKTIEVVIPASKGTNSKGAVKQSLMGPGKENSFSIPMGLIPQNSIINVLLLTPDDNISDLEAALSVFPDLAVTVFDKLSLPTLSVSDLLPYDVVMTTNNMKWLVSGGVDPIQVGDALADYIDASGKVIVNNFAYDWAGWELAGRFIDEQYGPFTMATSDISGTASLGTIYEPDHPILSNVTTITSSYLRQNQGLAPGATRIADWSDGKIFVVANNNTVGLNILPSDGGGIPGWTGDLPTLYHNAIVWLNGGAYWLSANPISGTIPAGTSMDIEVIFDATDLYGGEYDANIVMTRLTQKIQSMHTCM